MEKENYELGKSVKASSDYENITNRMDKVIGDAYVKTEKVISCLNQIRAFPPRDKKDEKRPGADDKLGFFDDAITRLDDINENLEVIVGHLVRTFGQ